MREYIRRFFQSAIDNIFTIIWTAVFALILSSVSYLFKSYLLKYWLFFAGFFTATIMITGISIFFIYLKSRQHKVLEELKNSKFASKEKGFLDHQADMEKASKEFNDRLLAISKEIAKVGQDSINATKGFQLIQDNPNKKQKLANNLAKKYKMRFAKIEEHVTSFEEITNLFVESVKGFFTWFMPKTEQEVQELQSLRDVYLNLTNNMRDTIASIRYYRDSQSGIKGISQDLNTAINQGIFVTEKLIDILLACEKDWNEVIKIIDKKLSTPAEVIK